MIGREGVSHVVTAEFLWKIFEATGSIAVYLLYKRLMLQ
ncbi:YqzL family protein [Lucifera butyrica]